MSSTAHNTCLFNTINFIGHSLKVLLISSANEILSNSTIFACFVNKNIEVTMSCIPPVVECPFQKKKFFFVWEQSTLLHGQVPCIKSVDQIPWRYGKLFNTSNSWSWPVTFSQVSRTLSPRSLKHLDQSLLSGLLFCFKQRNNIGGGQRKFNREM